MRNFMADRMEDARRQKRIDPLITVVLLAFGYGAVHAAGPGHGKALALAYMISRRRKLRDGILFGNLLSFAHGGTGILFVLLVKLVLSMKVGSTMAAVTRITQTFSFVLISGLGLFLTVKGLWEWTRKNRSAAKGQESAMHSKNPMAAALIIGMVPCPGVIMVMLFAMGMGQVLFGVMLGLSITAGMAATITAVVVAAMAGKTALLKNGFGAQRMGGPP